jgi:hypothetical protein
MKIIVLVELPRDEFTHLVIREGPVFVHAPQPGRSGVYEGEPKVIAQFNQGERKAKFEAEWVNEQWVIGRRFLDS